MHLVLMSAWKIGVYGEFSTLINDTGERQKAVDMLSLLAAQGVAFADALTTHLTHRSATGIRVSMHVSRPGVDPLSAPLSQ